MRNQFISSFLVLSVFLAGCLHESLSGGASITVDGGVVNVSANFTANASANLSQFDLIPGNASVCVYGEENEYFSGNAFGNLSFFGKNVSLWTKWLGLNSSFKKGAFASCAVIVLLDDAEGKFVERPQRQEIVEAVSKGAGLVVFGEAGARSAQDSSVYGWELGFGDLVPALIAAPGKDARPLGKRTFSGVFSITKPDSAFAGVNDSRFDAWTVVESQPTAGGDVIAVVRESDLPTSPVFPAIIRSTRPLGNAVYYFSFNGLDLPQVFVNAVRFQATQYVNLFFLRVV